MVHDFDRLRRDLREVRAQRDQARGKLEAARDRLRGLQREERALDRVFDADNRRHADARRAIARRRDEATTALGAARADYRALVAREHELLDLFARLADPREAIGRLSAEYPFLLFPVRLETRFTTTAGERGRRPQLWVRVYPDDCSIDTFEATLSDAEVTSARLYWRAVWEAGGQEDGERAAWRGLVASHGSGRAAWIAEQYRPRNLADRPTKARATDVVLVVVTDTPLVTAEAQATAAFWRTLWLADGDAGRESTARTDLVDAVGTAERAAELEARYAPVNFGQSAGSPLDRAHVNVQTAFLVLPRPEDVPVKGQSWTRAPHAVALPDRFVLIARTGGESPLVALGAPVQSPLVVGPDPSAPETERLRPDGDGLIVPEDMKWMVDFDRAVDAGMGFRIDLDPTQARRGFDRLFVLGLRLSADERVGQAELETLLRHHHYGRSGLALVPQGTPTNNTESVPSGFSRGAADADASFDDVVKGASLPAPSTDWLEKRDGQWLAEALGIDPAVLGPVRHADGSDQRESRAMNVALWPATLGYWMESLLEPVFSPSTIEETRRFFAHYVSGRGMLPALRIGAQPYGVLPVTAFSRLRWAGPGRDDVGRGAGLAAPPADATLALAARLYELWRLADVDWAGMAGAVAHTGAAGDAHRTLLDIVGLHPTSVEFAHRYAESQDELFNRLNLSGLGGLFAALVAGALTQSGRDLLRRFGYGGSEVPDLLTRFFLGTHHALGGPLIDDRPPSETDPIRAYTADTRNYLEWLRDAASTSLDALRREEGFLDGTPPRALLYVLLRHALQLGFYEVSVRLHEGAALFTADEAKQARREAPFIHVVPDAARSESRYQLLYKPEPALTNHPTRSVADHIVTTLGTLAEARPLREQLRALEVLRRTPTARLERLLAEHVDCCTYRLDAWLLGLVHYRLATLRGIPGLPGTPAPAVAPVRRGVYLGAYAWLEDVRPETRALSPADLPAPLREVFDRPGDAPLMRDSANEGYIHAPSLNHAVTAAVLRNGHLANAAAAHRDTLAVNLTSARVRTALALIEGLRGGQSLGALLGYQFERGLHDRHGLAEVDKFIYKIRKAFPLRADRLASTRSAPDVPIEAVEARNVMDGSSLVEHVKSTGNASYPFGKDLPPATPAEQTAIDAEVARLLDAHDAVADLVLAEGVHQAVQGNYDRVAATLDAFGRGQLPTDPDVVRSPTSGVGLTHRVGLHLPAGADPALSPVPGVAMTPRAQAEPALNRWLAAVLPPLAQVACKVLFRDAANAPAEREVTLAQLGLQPLDLLYLIPDEPRPAMAELDDRVVRRTVTAYAPRPDGGVAIRYMEKIGAPLSLFEILPLLRSLRRLALSSRALRASDLALHNEAARKDDDAVFVSRPRLVLVRDGLQAAGAALAALRATLAAMLGDLPARLPDLLANLDVNLLAAADRLAEAARFGVPQTGWGFVFEWRQRRFAALLERVGAVVARWDASLARFDAAMLAYDGLPASAGDQERFTRLADAERLIGTAPTTPRPATPAAFRAAMPGRRAAFVNRRDDFATLRTTTRTSLALFIADVRARLPIDDVDFVAFSLAEDEEEAVRVSADVSSLIARTIAEIDRRLAAGQARLTEHDNAGPAPARVAALQAAAKALLGDDAVVVPEFALTAAQGDELENALAAGRTGPLFDYLTTTGQVDFPLDEWLYGVARVRDKLREWEQVVMLAGAFGVAEPRLEALQLPFDPNDRWLALAFPADTALDRDRLLYTAAYGVPFDKTAPQCGLLLDEWTEVIPAATATTGIAFHFDRPSHEAPQAMLLVTAPEGGGSWRWADLVDALDETLDLARRRAVEPAQWETTPYARLLPATIMAVTASALTISANLALNNGVTLASEA